LRSELGMTALVRLASLLMVDPCAPKGWLLGQVCPALQLVA